PPGTRGGLGRARPPPSPPSSPPSPPWRFWPRPLRTGRRCGPPPAPRSVLRCRISPCWPPPGRDGLPSPAVLPKLFPLTAALSCPRATTSARQEAAVAPPTLQTAKEIRHGGFNGQGDIGRAHV